MRKISFERLSEIMMSKRKELSLSQEALQKETGINRLQIGKIENGKMIPSITQLEKIAEVLKFDMDDIFVEDTTEDVFFALRGQAETEMEKTELNHMFAMVLCLNQQKILRRRLGDVQ